MDFLGFTLSVWAAIAVGVFFMAMVLACTTDRYGNEGPKWFVLVAGLAIFAFIWRGELSWKYFLGAQFWKTAAIYLGIGLCYSIIEFWVGIRKAVRKWGQLWDDFKQRKAADKRHREQEALRRAKPSDLNERQTGRFHGQEAPHASAETLEQEFLKQTRSQAKTAFVKMELDDQNRIVPVVDRGELTESIGCWTLFWPAYAVSLVLGDLFLELCRKIADLVVSLSGKMVRRAFAKTFTP